MGKIRLTIWRPAYVDKKTGEVKISHLANTIKNTDENFTSDLIHNVGHASVLIEDDAGNKDYISYWPIKKALKKSYFNIFETGTFRNFDFDNELEGNRKNKVVIDFHHLNIEKVKKSRLYKDFKKVSFNNLYKTWTGRIHINTSQESENQNCCTVAWNLLLEAGILTLKPRRAGPFNLVLRKQYCCDEGQLFYGWFDSFFWRDWFMGPTLILHLAASAKEQELLLYNKKDVADDNLESTEIKSSILESSGCSIS